jgi:dedicated sortase system histidine kinase
MPQKPSPTFIQSLRFKLVVASLTLLAIPWVGYRYLQQTEETLRQAQEELLLSRAEVVAGLLADHTSELTQAPDKYRTLYVHPLTQPAVADGYAEEWQHLLTQARRYRASETDPQALHFDLLAGYHETYLYLLIRVHDANLNYPAANRELASGDHLILALPGDKRHTRQFFISTSSPGWISVLDRAHRRREHRIKGEWQENPNGYTVELRLPLTMARERLSLAVVDRVDPEGGIEAIASTSGWQRNEQLAHLVMPSLPSGTLLQGLDSRQHRYTILNSQRQVVGRHGSLAAADSEPAKLPQRLLGLLLGDPGHEAITAREHAGRMDGPEIRQALNGQSSIYRYRYPRRRDNTLSAAYPLIGSDRVSGVILVEQTTQNILLLQQQALERLLGTSLILILITGGTLFLLATWLTSRISRLNRKFNRAVNLDGRIIETVTGSHERDELGNLDRTFTNVLQRLQAYNHYLEQMASRLAHEFRTPLAMVQSSLENLRLDDIPKDHQRYTERALEGTKRLHLILNRLREATRLEQALQTAELTRVDLVDLCQRLCEGYRISHPRIQFDCALPTIPIETRAAPELISQALDKLVGNAIDFHTPETAIIIGIMFSDDRRARIVVDNQGPALPSEMEQALFQSMVSVREKSGDEPHLGLGLYLVRLILEFHDGLAKAENTPNGVRFILELPVD